MAFALDSSGYVTADITMVAIKASEAESFLRSIPNKINALLFYGSDDGLISERAGVACKVAAARTNPPGEMLRLDELDIEQDPGRINVELTTVSMFGGPRIVRVAASRRVNAAHVGPLLEGKLEGMLVVEAGNLKADEGLRGLFEKSAIAAAVGCFPDNDRDLEGLIAKTLTANGLDISNEAKQSLLARLGADRGQSRAELEKLALYCHGRRRVELADIEAATGDASELALDTVLIAAASGNASAALAAAERAFAGGESPQLLIISAQRYFQRLHRLRIALDSTGSVEGALRSLRPPLHFKIRDAVTRHTRAWSAGKITRAMERISTAQRSARSSVIDDALAADRLVLDLARLANASDR